MPTRLRPPLQESQGSCKNFQRVSMNGALTWDSWFPGRPGLAGPSPEMPASPRRGRFLAMTPEPLQQLYFGGDYNPEQWPEEVWPEDVALMREAGVTIVTVGVFAWARIQPDEGVFDYDWLDRVHGPVARQRDRRRPRHRHRFAAAVGHHPLPGDADPDPGGRDPLARRPPALGADLAGLPPPRRRPGAATVERYRDHPAVVLWHINNELGCHMAYDYSDQAAAAFRDWLRTRYADIDALNDAWGTWFWSQRYTDFDQILPPRLAPYSVEPDRPARLPPVQLRRTARPLCELEKRIIRDRSGPPNRSPRT